jgi:hypothetical protein
MLQVTSHHVDIDLLKQALSTVNNDQFKLSLNQPTGEFFYDPWVIKPEFKNTVWESILNSLPYIHGEARIITLKPGTAYCCHADADDRWHLNLQSECSFICDLDHEVMHKVLTDGYWYNMNAGRRHTATNFGSIDRIQLVVRQLLHRNTLINPVPIKIITKIQTTDFRYQFDNTISLWLNAANKTGIINNFKFVETEVSFDIEHNSLSELNKIVPSTFEVVR